jgi:uncharacterized OB-fold protein
MTTEGKCERCGRIIPPCQTLCRECEEIIKNNIGETENEIENN